MLNVKHILFSVVTIIGSSLVVSCSSVSTPITVDEEYRSKYIKESEYESVSVSMEDESEYQMYEYLSSELETDTEIEDLSPSNLIDSLNHEGYKLVEIGTPNRVKTLNTTKINKDLGYTYEDAKSLNYTISNNKYKLNLSFENDTQKIEVFYTYNYNGNRVVLPGSLGLGKDWESCEIKVYNQ